ncbi:hypothetical protein LHK94_14430 [Dickeya zeae]|uniref:hypothetical protein n=1 Tax=Dickeya zeae TaxID=204042 RepID=UPI001CFA9FCA|nr:hypothetical protein [Dickeya zeae]UCZ77514.1 hypothetical protein LHK94_14430 [Dickeya zeae]
MTMQCGNFRMGTIPDFLFKINGETVTSQKIKILGGDSTGMKIDIALVPARNGRNYGFQYINQPGSDSRFLMVELLRASMDAPCIIGSFPCKKLEN